MKKRVYVLLLGIASVFAGTTVPVTERITVPPGFELVAAITRPCIVEDTTTATTTVSKSEYQFDCEGMIDLAIFENKGGQQLLAPISSSTHAAMRGKNGAQHNPKREDFTEGVTLAEMLVPSAEAAITLENRGGNAVGSVTTHTLANQNIPAGTNYVIVGISESGTDDIVSGVTVAGDSLTEIGSVYTGSSNGTMYNYYIDNPTTGTQNIVVSYSSTAGYSAVGWAAFSADSGALAIGASQTGNFNTEDPVTIEITTENDGSYLMAPIKPNRSSGGTADTGTHVLAGLVGDAGVVMSDSSVGTAGAKTLGWNPNSAELVSGYYMVEIYEAAGGGGGGARRIINTTVSGW